MSTELGQNKDNSPKQVNIILDCLQGNHTNDDVKCSDGMNREKNVKIK